MGLTNKISNFFRSIPSELTNRVKSPPLPDIYWIYKDDQGDYFRFSEEMPSQTLEDFQVEELGEPQQVHHLTFHDMQGSAIIRDITKKGLAQGLETIAVYIDRDKFERTGGGSAYSTYQLMKITFEDSS